MRDGRGRSRPPVRAGEAVQRLAEELAPDTPLGSVQAVWPGVVGEAITGVTTVISEREGLLEVACVSSVWADELSMMEPEIRRRINDALGGDAIESIKFRTGR